MLGWIAAFFFILGGMIMALFTLVLLGAKTYRFVVVKSGHEPATRRMVLVFCSIICLMGLWLAWNCDRSGEINIAALALGAGICAFHFGGAFGTFLTY